MSEPHCEMRKKEHYRQIGLFSFIYELLPPPLISLSHNLASGSDIAACIKIFSTPKHVISD